MGSKEQRIFLAKHRQEGREGGRAAYGLAGWLAKQPNRNKQEASSKATQEKGAAGLAVQHGATEP